MSQSIYLRQPRIKQILVNHRQLNTITIHEEKLLLFIIWQGRVNIPNMLL